MRRSRTEGQNETRAVFRPLLLLAVTVFIDLLGFGMVLPNMPQYIETAVGRDHAYAASIGGLLAASYSFTQFLCAPLWGRYSDRAGRRPVILLSLLGVAAAYALFGLAGEHLWILFAARLIAGVLSSASLGVAFAYVADVTTPENRARGLGLLGACLGLGFVFGPAFGGLLGGIHLGLPAFVAAGMALVNFVFTLRFLPESLSREARRDAAGDAGRYSPALLLRVTRGPAGFLFVLTFLITLGFSALEQTFSFYLLSVFPEAVTNRNQPAISGMILGLAGVAAILVQGGLIGRLVGRFGEGRIALAGITLMVIGFLLFPAPRQVWALAAGPMLVLSVGRALAAPTLSALVSRKAELGQGLTLSTAQSFDALARTVGPIFGGFLFARVDAAAPYLSAAIILTVALLLALSKRQEMALAAPLSKPAQEV